VPPASGPTLESTYVPEEWYMYWADPVASNPESWDDVIR
jgi:hypothetical protein